MRVLFAALVLLAAAAAPVPAAAGFSHTAVGNRLLRVLPRFWPARYDEDLDVVVVEGLAATGLGELHLPARRGATSALHSNYTTLHMHANGTLEDRTTGLCRECLFEGRGETEGRMRGTLIEGELRAFLRHGVAAYGIETARLRDGSLFSFAFMLRDAPQDYHRGFEPSGFGSPSGGHRAPHTASRFTDITAEVEVTQVLSSLLVDDYGSRAQTYAASLFTLAAGYFDAASFESTGDRANVKLVLVRQISVALGAGFDVGHDAEGYISSSAFLKKLGTYRAANPSLFTDVAMGLVSRTFAGDTLGLAYTSSACDSSFALAVTSTSRGSPGAVAAIEAHEVLHLLGVPHLSGSGSGDGIMSPTINIGSDTVVSAITTVTIEAAQAYMEASGSCLEARAPGASTWFSTAVCGDGITQPGEACDDGATGSACCTTGCVYTSGAVCGTTDPCCNAATCTLTSGGQTRLCTAASGDCLPSVYCDGLKASCPVQTPTCGSSDGGGYGGVTTTHSSGELSEGAYLGIILGSVGALAVVAFVWNNK